MGNSLLVGGEGNSSYEVRKWFGEKGVESGWIKFQGYYSIFLPFIVYSKKSEERRKNLSLSLSGLILKKPSPD